MKPLILYPQKWRLGVGIGLGLVMTWVGYGFLGNAQGDVGAMIVPGAIIALGVILTGMAGWRLASGKPSFTADKDGFSVTGRAKRPWSDFIDAQPCTIRYGLLPIGTYLAVRVNGRPMAKKLNITWSYLSGPTKEMATQIMGYRKMVEMQAALDAVAASRPKDARSDPAVAAKTHPAFVALPPATVPLTETGPIRSRKSLSERLFGKKPEVL